MSQQTVQEHIEALANATLDNSFSVQHLNMQLRELTSVLENESMAALAFISETIATNCDSLGIGEAEQRLALFDLCDRLLQAIESNDPFSLSGIDESLEAMLFARPESRPHAPALVEHSIDTAEENERSVAEALTDDSLEKNGDEDALAKCLDGSPGNDAQRKLAACQCSDPELLDEFLDEADEHLDQAEQLILTLEENPSHHEALHGVFRAVHSLKGSSGILSLTPLAKFSHSAESMLVKIRDGVLELDGHVFSVVLAAMDCLRKQIKSIRDNRQPSGAVLCLVASPELFQALDAYTEKGKCDIALVQRLRQASITTEPDNDQVDSPRKQPQQESLRVDGKRLEQLIDLIGELVITESAVAQELRKQDSLTASSVSTRLKKVVREVQQLSLALKMVPVGTILQKMNRMVRDVSEKLGKPCRFVIEGADSEVDKTLLEGLADPLVHLIRNSLDHGIETSVQDRIAAGKPSTATVKVTAEHRAGNILITVADDGRGLNRERILSRAIEKGIVPSHARLTDSEIDQLIFKPGFSTAAAVTDISGRGVGMDVVRKNVENLRGSITVSSVTGKGSSICLELPLTLSIIDGTVINVGRRSFIIPTLSVIEQVQASTLEMVCRGGQRLAHFRDAYIPVSQLSQLLGLPEGEPPKNGQVCLVVQACQKTWALLVDRVIGQQPIVIKPLGGVLEAFDYFAGGALLANGEIGFVLDLNTLLTSGRRKKCVDQCDQATVQNPRSMTKA